MNSDWIRYLVSDYAWIGYEVAAIAVMLVFIVKLTKKKKNMRKELESSEKKRQEDLLEQSLVNEKRRSQP